MDWATIIQAVIGAGIGSAVIQGVFPILRERWERKAQSVYLSIRLAIVLEAYASACQDLMQYNDNAEQLPDERLPHWRIALPDLASYPDDAGGWRGLDSLLATRVLTFRNKVAESQGLIHDTAYFNDDKLGDAVEVEATARGLEAWRLAVDLRKKHRLGSADLVWNYVEPLERREHRMREEAEQRRTTAARSGML